MAERTYTAAEQAEWSRKYPGLVWIQGKPYTTAAPEGNGDGVGDDYLGANAAPKEEGQGHTLYPANLTTRFPWEFVAAQIAGPAIVNGLGAAFSGGGGAASAGGGTAATTGGATAAGTTAAGSTLPAVAPGVAGGAATGGGVSALSTLSKYLPYIEAGGRVAGAAVNARANNRVAEADYNAERDRAEVTRQALLNDQRRLDLQQRQYADDKYARQGNNAVRADLLRGIKDVNISSPSQVPRSQVTGGLRPSAIANRGDIGDVIYQRAMADLVDPIGAGGITNASGVAEGAGSGSRNLPAIPYLPPLRDVPASTGVDRGLGLINMAASGIGVLDELRNRRPSTPAAPAPAAIPGTTPQPSWLPRVSFR